MSSVLRCLTWPMVVVGIAALAVGDAFSLDRGVVVSVATAILLLAGCLFWPWRAAATSAAPPTAAQEGR